MTADGAGGGGEVEGSAARHPSAWRAGGPLRAPIARAMGRLGGIDGPHVRVATTLLAVRGSQGRTPAAFAAAYGLSEAELARMESGWVAWVDLPAPVRLLTPVAALLARPAEPPD